jgi:SAM-dependent methyltransferase
MSETQANGSPQEDFLSCYRGRQASLHHMAYMRMAKVLLALYLCQKAGIILENKSIFDYGFGTGTFFRYCPPSSRLSGVELDSENVFAVQSMLRKRGLLKTDLHPIDIQFWSEHPLLKKRYDIVLCSHVLEHIADPVSFLERMRDCIDTGGVFIGLVPINERKIDPHHVQEVNRRKIEEWAELAGLQINMWLEADPWLYWVQPIFASRNKGTHLIAEMISVSLGVPATAMGPQMWFRLGNLFGWLTRSLPTQAAFVLTHHEVGLASRSAQRNVGLSTTNV